MAAIIRVGIVGCGDVAQLIHIPTLQNLRERFQIVAICDVSRAVLQGVGNQIGVAHRFIDYNDLIAHTDVDAVLISNPHVYHAEVAMAAMAAGKHVLIEKPMCISLAQADALIDQERKARIVAQVGFMRRYAPAFTEAIELVRDLKDIRLARVHDSIGRNALIIDHISNVIRPTDLPERVVEELRLKQIEMVTAAVGALPAPLDAAYQLLLGLSSHDLSAMRELLGLPRGVLYAASRGSDGRTISAAFDYGDFVCQFETTVDSVPRFDAHIEVFSPSKVIRVDFDTPYVRNLPGRLTILDSGANGMVRRQSQCAWQDAFEIEWRSFHDSITFSRQPKTSIVDARQDLVLFQEMMTHMKVNRAKAA